MMEAHGAADGASEIGKGADVSLQGSAAEQGGEPETVVTVDDSLKEKQETVEDTSWFDPKRFAIKYRQREIYPKDPDELRNWSQLGYENERRMASLKEREETLTASEKEIGDYKKLAQQFEQNPEFAQAVKKLALAYASGNQAAVAEATGEATEEGSLNTEQQALLKPYIDKIARLEESIGKVESRFQDYDSEKADSEVKQEIENLKTKYPNEDWDTPDEKTGNKLELDLLEYAAKKQLDSLEDAYTLLMHGSIVEKAKAEALKEAQSNKQKSDEAGKISDGGGAGSTNKTVTINPREKSYTQLAEIAAKSLTG